MSQHVDVVDSYRSRRIRYWTMGIYADAVISVLGVYFILKTGISAIGGAITAICISIACSYFGLRYVENNAHKVERRCSISPEKIEIVLWNRPVFQVEWLKLKAIHILKEDRGTDRSELLHYTLSFTEEPSSSRSIAFDCFHDFSSKKLEWFVYFLTRSAQQRNVLISGRAKGIRRLFFANPKYERDLSEWKVFQSKSMQKKWENVNKGIQIRF